MPGSYLVVSTIRCITIRFLGATWFSEAGQVEATMRSRINAVDSAKLRCGDMDADRASILTQPLFSYINCKIRS